MNSLQHIAIIPDGNRRWAEKNGLPSFEGHNTAFNKTLPALLRKAAELQVKYFTFWALSPENYTKRSKMEIEGLLSLGKIFYEKRLNELHKEGVKVQFIGNIKALPSDVQTTMSASVEKTKNNETITLIIAINYGGRDELLRAVQKVTDLNYLAKSVNQENFCQFLDTKNIPDPDLIIRPGGEKRLSGFMPWQSVYSELYFSDLLFPDFSPAELEKAVNDFSDRKRRFGK